ncbi:MAG: formylglycine-generating enzyme family protein [Planctomycetota bacterium]
MADSFGESMGRVVTHPLASGVAPDWASGWGEDEFGPFASLSRGGIRQRFRWLPPAEFQCGSPKDEEGRFSDEMLVTAKLTRGLWIGDTPCTNALWAAVMGTDPESSDMAEHPVTRVSWKDIQAFMHELNERPGVDAFRLPTDAEWEYACRGGTEGEHYGIDLGLVVGDVAWYLGNSGGQTHRVGLKLSNRFGLYDTLGNVDEWVADAATYDVDTGEVRGDFGGVDAWSRSGEERVIRGGSWGAPPQYVRAAYRDALLPGGRDDDLGFRLARGQGVQASTGGGARGAGRATEPEPGHLHGGQQ